MPSYASTHNVVKTLIAQLIVQTWWNYVDYDDAKGLVSGEKALEILRNGQPSHLKTAGLPLLLLDPIAAVGVESVIDFPDPGPPPQPRYQITIQLDAATQ